jgi:ABC-type methionine transport system ATPase subunit
MQEIKVELFIPGELKEEPIICTMIKDFDVSMKIVEASFSTESGWAYLILKGEKAEMDKVFGYLEEKSVKVEIRK